MARRFDVEVSIALAADITANPSTWSWTDITSYAMVREGGVSIRRGRPDWQGASTPASCTVLLNNADGRFSRLNPTGTYYGQLTKNTPLRVRAREVGGSYSTRFVGFVSEWPTEWEPAEKHFWVSVTANGSLRRLVVAGGLLNSALRRSLIRSSAVLSYWPLEDGSGSTAAASGLPNGQPLLVTVGSPGFGSASAPAGSANVIELSGGGGLAGPGNTPTTIPAAMRLQFLMKFPTGGAASTKRAFLNWNTVGGTYTTWWFGINASNELYVEGYTPTGSLGVDMSPFPTTGMYDGQWHRVEIGQRYNEISGALITYLQIDSANRGTGPTSLGANETFGYISPIAVNPFNYSGSFMPAIGHLTVVVTDTNFSVADPLAADPAMGGYVGEMAHDRVERLCGEESVAVSINATESQEMGPQSQGTLVDALRESETADVGLVIERKTGEIGFDSHTDRENINVALALDYDAGHIHPPFEPADDDQVTKNDVTVSRPEGSFARYVLADGPMGTGSVTGAGRYEESITANVYRDSQLLNVAGQRVSLGTVNEHRFPNVILKLHRSSGLIAAWKTADISSRVTINNLPSKLPPDLVDQIIEGYTERINQMEWEVTLNLSPYKPHKIIAMADTPGDSNVWLGRAAGDPKAAIRSAITNSGTSIDIDPNRFRWTTLIIKDTFTRSVGSSWGSPDLGIAWALDVGTAADFSVNGSVGIMSHPTAGVNHSQIIFTGPDSDSVIHFNLPAAPVGGGGQVIVVVRPRWTDANNHYEVRATVNTGGSITTELRKRVAGSPTTIASGPNFTLSTSAWYALRISTVGTTIRAKIWDTSGTEPDWQLAAADTSLTTGNFISVLSVTTGITNLPYTVNFDNFAVSGATGEPDDFNPFPTVRFGGETATIKGISTTAVTYVAAGAASHADNAAVTPALYAGSAANDGIFLAGRIRGTAGSLATPTGYTLLGQIGKLYLWTKVHSGSESNPTVTPSGGAAGDTVSAFTFGFRGTSCTLSNPKDNIVDSVSVLNASAANIAYYGIYPWQQDGCLLLVIAGKSDDWTSAAITGWTEIAEPTTVTGNDQSLYAAYIIQTAATVVNEGTITVTGGASAVSESMTLAIAAGYQTLTVNARSTNGAVKAHSAGTTIEVETYALGL